MPVDVVRAMGAEVVIGVDLLACGATFRKNSRTGVGIMIQSVLSLLRTNAKNEHADANIVIVPKIAHLRPDQIGKRVEFIRFGEQAAKEKVEEIKRLLDYSQ